jgi:N utilization substance protein B
LVGETAENWRLERLSRVDLNVIRIAVYELTTEPPVPVEVAINEAIEVARRFGTEQSAGFVNGVLDQVAVRLGRKVQGEQKAGQGNG